MRDITTWIVELEEAKYAMQSAKRRIKSEVEREYKPRMLAAITERTADAEAEFARRLRIAVEAGVPQSVIRRDILRTNDWARWVYWRDRAEITPERITIQDAKEARDLANVPYRWSDDFTEVTWLRDLKNKELAKPIRVAVDFGHLHFPDVHPEDKDFAITTFGSLTKFFESVVPVIQEKHGKNNDNTTEEN